MPMPTQILDNMYWSGFCDATIRQAASTDFATGGDKRLAWLRPHVETCRTCRRASIFKALELRVAQKMGPEAIIAFQLGDRSLAERPGYDTHLKTVIDAAIRDGLIIQSDIDWMTETVLRHGIPWPGHENTR